MPISVEHPVVDGPKHGTEHPVVDGPKDVTGENAPSPAKGLLTLNSSVGERSGLYFVLGFIHADIYFAHSLETGKVSAPGVHLFQELQRR